MPTNPQTGLQNLPPQVPVAQVLDRLLAERPTTPGTFSQAAAAFHAGYEAAVEVVRAMAQPDEPREQRLPGVDSA